MLPRWPPGRDAGAGASPSSAERERPRARAAGGTGRDHSQIHDKGTRDVTTSSEALAHPTPLPEPELLYQPPTRVRCVIYLGFNNSILSAVPRRPARVSFSRMR